MLLTIAHLAIGMAHADDSGIAASTKNTQSTEKLSAEEKTALGIQYEHAEGVPREENHRGIPPYQETQNYVRKISLLYRKSTHPFKASFHATRSIASK